MYTCVAVRPVVCVGACEYVRVCSYVCAYLRMYVSACVSASRE